MYRIHPSFLCWVLENLVAGEVVNQVLVPDEIAIPARMALETMLRIPV
jgi:quinolinate synthase